ncbi:MAG TPA: hypothetical protein VN887_16900 [Candidatus Angelobacter sp.]|nr:hypothetical protein [Candidatus Angelobacter sp.]
MILAPDIPTERASYLANELPRTVEVSSSSQFDLDVPIEAELDQRHFAFGEYFLILERYPTIAYYRRTYELEIRGWNVRLPWQRGGEISREIIRKFLFLLRKAERKELSKHEEREWEEISRQADYRRFCVEHAPAIFTEGRLLAATPADLEIEWHDGTKEVVPRSVAKSLELLNPGESFTALANFGEGNKLVSISQVAPAPSAEVIDGETLWRSWPSNRS